MEMKKYEFTFDYSEISKELLMASVDNFGEQICAAAKHEGSLMRVVSKYAAGSGIKSFGYAGTAVSIALTVDSGASEEEIVSEITGAIVGTAAGIVAGAFGAFVFSWCPPGAVVAGVALSAAGSYYGGQFGKTLGKNVYGILKEIIDDPPPPPGPFPPQPGGGKGFSGGFVYDPLALDLNGDGVKFVKDGAYFDYDANGVVQKATWLDKNDGWLVLDRNGDGVINNGAELFGDSTRKKNGELAKDGFDALAENDANGDGKIDAADEVFDKLRVWVDADSDGITDSGELRTLRELGIKEISLSSVPVVRQVKPNGEMEIGRGSFVWENGAAGQMGCYLVTNSSCDVKETDLIEVPADVELLPDVRNWGKVHSLHQAMARDAGLKDLVKRYVSGGNQDKETLIAGIIYEWCGTDTVAPKSRGGVFDARKLEAMEALFGEEFKGKAGFGMWSNNPTHWSFVDELEKMFRGLCDWLQSSLIVQSSALKYLVKYQTDENGTITGADLETTKTRLDSLISMNKEKGLELLGDFVHAMKLQYYSDASSRAGEFKTFCEYYAQRGSEYAEALKWRMTMGAADTALIGTWLDDYIVGNDNDNVIESGDGDDIVYGGKGNDTLSSGEGRDVYVFKRGDGQDIIDDCSGDDILQFGEGIGKNDLAFKNDEGSLLITVNDSGGSILLKDYYDYHGSCKINKIRFADGSEMSSSEMEAAARILQGTDGDDTLRTWDYGSYEMSGGAGNDILVNYYNGDAVMTGGKGDDNLNGGYGARAGAK